MEFTLPDYGTLFHLDTTNWYCLLNPLKAILQRKQPLVITTGNNNKEYNEVRKSDYTNIATLFCAY